MGDFYLNALERKGDQPYRGEASIIRASVASQTFLIGFFVQKFVIHSSTEGKSAPLSTSRLSPFMCLSILTELVNPKTQLVMSNRLPSSLIQVPHEARPAPLIWGCCAFAVVGSSSKKIVAARSVPLCIWLPCACFSGSFNPRSVHYT
ncbi:hypothetical protein D9M68_678510 [compost metagenome]